MHGWKDVNPWIPEFAGYQWVPCRNQSDADGKQAERKFERNLLDVQSHY